MNFCMLSLFRKILIKHTVMSTLLYMHPYLYANIFAWFIFIFKIAVMSIIAYNMEL